MRSSKGAALAPLTGVLAALLYAAGILMSADTPDSDASGAKVLAYYVSHTSDQQAAAVVFGYGSLFLVLFGAALRSGLRRGEREADGPATLAFGGALLMGTGLMLLTGFGLALAEKPSALDPAAAQAINAIQNSLWIPFIVGQAVLMLGAGVAILRGGALPSWLGWVAFVLGVVSASPVGWFAFFLVLLWIVVVAILLARRASAAGREASAEVTSAA